MKALIINFNRLTLPVAMADWLADHGCEPIIVDNGSDYPPLLRYYAEHPSRVLRLEANYGHTVIWDRPQVLTQLGIQERFIMTDPDLALEGVDGPSRRPPPHRW